MNIKRNIKNYIIHNTSLNKLYENNILLKDNLLTLLSRDSIWIYSLMKSGTTYTALFLSNYFNYLYGDKKGVDFDQMNQKYCIHTLEKKIENKDFTKRINDNLFFTGNIPQYKSFFTTHMYFPDGQWKKNICLNRNPLDYLISIYFFHYVNRGRKCSHPRKIIERKIPEFIITIKNQNYLIQSNPNNVLEYSYEKLVTSPKDAFIEIIKFLELEIIEEGVNFSLENSSKKKIKEMEKNRGEAIVKKDGINFKGSFIRSGKIGEWKQYFNDKDLKKIDNLLLKENISLNNFTLE